MEKAKPINSLPSKAPIVWPPIFWLTTNMRSGTRSTSSNFQTSFCSATQALSSSMPSHFLMVICWVPGTVAFTSYVPPAFWPAAIMLPFLPARLLPAYDLARVIFLPASQSAAEIFCWCYARQIPDQQKDSAQYLPAQKTDHQLHLPHAV